MHKTSFLVWIRDNLLEVLLPRSRTLSFLEQTDSATFVSRVRHPRQHLPDITSLFDYQDPLVKTLVWEIKFKGNRSLAKLAAELLYEELLVELSERLLFEHTPHTPLLVPVPLAPQRLQERGFNQVERIAKEMLALDEGKHFFLSTLVSRKRETKSQTQTQNRSERVSNLRGAFSITDVPKIKGAYVIILDDVATTGSTIGEIRRILLEAGARSVTGLTLAH
jgi:ComF family protein